MSFDPQKHELQTLKGDPVAGMESTLKMPILGKPVVEYKDRYLIECDVYFDAAENELVVIWICPNCRNRSRIRSSNKQIDYDKELNLLSIEPFICPWENAPTDGRKADRIIAGIGLCRLKLGIEKNRALDAR